MEHDRRGMTIDELARESGATSRNIRAYQTRGLLPSPRMEGRVGYYDEGHLARLRYIAGLQERGFSLASIQCLLDAWEEGRGLNDVLGFEEALTAPWSDESPERVRPERLMEMFPDALLEPGLLERSIELGLLVVVDDEFEAPSPLLLRIGSELVAAGVPLAAVLDEYERLVADADRIALRFVDLFESNVWEPFVTAGMPPERLAEVTDALQRVRPLASMTMDATLAHAMERAVAASTARQMARFLAAGSQPATHDAGSQPATLDIGQPGDS